MCSVSWFKYWKQIFSHFSALGLGVIISVSSAYMNLQLLEVSILQWAQHTNSVCKFIWEMLLLKWAPISASTCTDNVSNGLNTILLWNCSFLDSATWVNILVSLLFTSWCFSVTRIHYYDPGMQTAHCWGIFFLVAWQRYLKQSRLEIGTYCNTQGQWKVFVVQSISCTFEISVISIFIRKGVAEAKSNFFAVWCFW